ncbi:hypothetical protein AAI421_15700 [Rhodococcus aetherivorans]|uniref:hypothetical protein n=1 Tax=Rhodococcus TaxID=1827 RepID=UPI001187447E|nr:MULTISPECIES: hypothetical protein [Rhodococcus]USC16656.1 hypothetical protein KZJ41_07150 [Rhodococcus sp. 11-3]
MRSVGLTACDIRVHDRAGTAIALTGAAIYGSSFRTPALLSASHASDQAWTVTWIAVGAAAALAVPLVPRPFHTGAAIPATLTPRIESAPPVHRAPPS